MSARTRLLSLATAAYMVIVWVTRIRNAAADDTISTATRLGAFTLSALGLAGAALLVVLAVRNARPAWVVAVVSVHAGVWLVRGTQIALGARSIGFKAVHVVLALIAVALAVAVVRSARSTRPTALVGPAG